MIPDPSYDWVQAQQRAINMADDFVAQTRARTQMVMAQQQTAFTGGVGGPQPGVLSFAANMAGSLPMSMASSFQQQAQVAAMRGATFAGGAATLAAPAYNQVMEIGEGARYGGALNRMRLSGLLATAYAPRSVFPHAGMAFGMDGGLRRQMAQEETSRRLTQGVLGGGLEFLDTYSMGVSSFLMRRSGVEASTMTRMETERTLQNRLGFLRGGQYQSATGFGVRRGYLTEGAGRGLMEGVQSGVADLQAKYGYNVDQMNMLTRSAFGAVDVTQIQQADAGGLAGQRRLGGQISGIRDTMAKMARDLQMSEAEAEKYFSGLTRFMRVTDGGLKAFAAENKRAALSGPFSESQITTARGQFMQMGREAFMGGNFSTQAVGQALQVNQMRQTGTIRADTLLREGGGLDPQAMMQMTARRLQQQVGLVQSGGFFQALMLQQANPEAYRGLMGGAGFFETQAAAAGAMVRSPFAMLMSRMSREGAQRVAFDAPMLAFRAAGQMNPMMVGTAEEKRAQRISIFGKNMGFSVNTPAGMAEAVTRYEEIEDVQAAVRERVVQGVNSWKALGAETPGLKAIRRMADDMSGLVTNSGASMEEVSSVLDRVRTDVDLHRRISGASSYRERAELYQGALTSERTDRIERSMQRADWASAASMKAWGRQETRTTHGSAFARGLSRLAGGAGESSNWVATFSDPKKALRDINRFAIDRRNLGISSRDLSRAAFGRLSEWQETKQTRGWGDWWNSRDVYAERQLVFDEAGKAQWQVRSVSMTAKEREKAWQAYKAAKPDEVAYSETDVIRWYTDAGKGKAWQETTRDFEGDPEDLEAIRAEHAGGYTKVDWQRQQESRAAVDELQRKSSTLLDAMGLTLGKDATLSDVADQLLQGKMDSLALATDTRLKPVATLLERVREAGGTTAEALKKMDFSAFKDVNIGTMRQYFKKYGESEQGSKVVAQVLGGTSMDKAKRDDLEKIYRGMSAEEQRGFVGASLTEAMNKSSRLMTEDPGSYGKPYYVVIKGDISKMRDEQKPGERGAA